MPNIGLLLIPEQIVHQRQHLLYQGRTNHDLHIYLQPQQVASAAAQHACPGNLEHGVDHHEERTNGYIWIKISAQLTPM